MNMQQLHAQDGDTTTGLRKKKEFSYSTHLNSVTATVYNGFDPTTMLVHISILLFALKD